LWEAVRDSYSILQRSGQTDVRTDSTIPILAPTVARSKVVKNTSLLDYTGNEVDASGEWNILLIL